MRGPEALAEAIDKAVNATNDQLMQWAASGANNGPFAEEAYRANLHITAAMRIFGDHLKKTIVEAPR